MRERENNAFGENKWIAQKKFEKKMEKLKEMHPNLVKTIRIVWQCEWQALKREDEAAKHFVNNVYRFPPLFRLNPEKAGKNYMIQ